MFEVYNCSRCGSPVTPGKDSCTDENGNVVCERCQTSSPSSQNPSANFLESFETLKRTTFIQNCPERRYLKAASVKEMIEIFERGLRFGKVKEYFSRIMFILIAVGVLAGGYLYFKPKWSKTEITQEQKESEIEKKDDGKEIVKGTGGENDKDVPDETGPDNAVIPETAEIDNKEAEENLSKLKEDFAESQDLFLIRHDIKKGLIKYKSYPGHLEFLNEIESQISESANKKWKQILAEKEDLIKTQEYSRAYELIGEWEGVFSDTRWFAAEGGMALLNNASKEVLAAWEREVKELLTEGEAFEHEKRFPEAYEMYEKALKICMPGDTARIDHKIKEVFAQSSKYFGDQGLEAYLKWQKYVEFRRDFLYYLKVRDFKRVKAIAREYLEDSKYAMIAEDITFDLMDVNTIEQVLQSVTAYMSEHIGQNYNLNTQAGRVTGLIKSVVDNSITIITSEFDITIPISRLAVDEIKKMWVAPGGDEGSFSIAVGLLFLSEGLIVKAKIEFGRARELGLDTERYMKHIKAAESDKVEKEAAKEFKKIENLINRKSWEKLIDVSLQYKRKFGLTRFYGRKVDYINKAVLEGRLSKENRVTFAQRFLPGPEYRGCSDTILNGTTSSAKRKNYGRNEYLRASGDWKMFSVIKYDLSMIPSHAKIYEARFSIFCKEVRDKLGTPLLKLFRVTESWEEGVKKMGKPATGATWFEPVFVDGANTKSGNWKVYGGTVNNTDDFGYGPNGVIAEQPCKVNTFIEFDVTKIVREWISCSKPNFGMLLKIFPKGKAERNSVYFYSSNYSGNFARHPRLYVHFKGTGENIFDRLALMRFEGFPGKEETFVFKNNVSPDKKSKAMTTILIRDNVPNRAEKKNLWRGRIGNINNSFNRVLLAFSRALDIIPPGSRIKEATLKLFIKDIRKKKKDLHLLLWHIKSRWDLGSANWINSSTGNRWSVPGCSGDNDRYFERAASALVKVKKGSWLAIDITESLDEIVRGEKPGNGFLLTLDDETRSSVTFVVENDKSKEKRPELSVTYFQSDLGSFVPLFDPHKRESWAYASVRKCDFKNGDISFGPATCLVTKNGTFTDFVIKGRVKKHKGEGPVVFSLKHAEFGRYNIIIGYKCGVVYDRSGSYAMDTFWSDDTPLELSAWTPFELSLNNGVLYVKVGSLDSGPIKDVHVRDTEIWLKAEGCYVSFKELVVGKKRK